MTSSDRNSGFVTAENEGDQKGSGHLRMIFNDCIL